MYGFEGNISTTIGWIAMTFDIDTHVPLKMNCKNFGDPLTFHQHNDQVKNLNLSYTLVYDQ